MEKHDVPLGFGMALMQNEEAMHAFEAMTEAEKETVIQKTHSVNSRQEMARLVAGLVNIPETDDYL